MFPDLGQPLPGNAPPAGDVLEERHHLLRTLGAAERHQQYRLVRIEAGSLIGTGSLVGRRGWCQIHRVHICVVTHQE